MIRNNDSLQHYNGGAEHSEWKLSQPMAGNNNTAGWSLHPGETCVSLINQASSTSMIGCHPQLLCHTWGYLGAAVSHLSFKRRRRKTLNHQPIRMSIAQGINLLTASTPICCHYTRSPQAAFTVVWTPLVGLNQASDATLSVRVVRSCLNHVQPSYRVDLSYCPVLLAEQRSNL